MKKKILVILFLIIIIQPIAMSQYVSSNYSFMTRDVTLPTALYDHLIDKSYGLGLGIFVVGLFFSIASKSKNVVLPAVLLLIISGTFMSTIPKEAHVIGYFLLAIAIAVIVFKLHQMNAE